MDPIELGWIIGLFEGEGSIVISKPGSLRGNGRRLPGHVAITVSNTSEALLFPFSVHYGGEVKTWERPKLKGGGLTRRWVCPASSKRKFLTDIMPYIKGVKKEKAEIALEFLSTVRARGGRIPFSPEEMETKRRLYDRFYPMKQPL